MKVLFNKYKKYIFNSGWLFLEKVLSVVLGFTIGILTVRYLGPERLGALSYVLSIIAFCSPIVHLGLNGMLQRELIDNEDQQSRIIVTVLVMKFSAGIFCVLILFLFSYLYDFKDERIAKLLPIVSITLIAAPITGVFGSWFSSRILAKYNVYSNGLSIITNSSLKLLGVLSRLSLVFFACVEVISKFVAALVYSILFRKMSNVKLSSNDFDFSLAKRLIKESKWIVFSTFSALIYLKIDQLMIGNMLSMEILGIYSSAVRISEQLYIIPGILMASLFPPIIRAKKESVELYKGRLQFCYDLMFFISFSLAVLIMFFSKYIISILYGNEFLGAGQILSTHVYSGVFVFWGAVSSKWLVIEKLSGFLFVRSLAGAIINIIINIFLIPLLGGVGAAIATLISYGFTHFIMFALYKKTQGICFVMIKSIFFIPRYIYKKRKSFNLYT